MKGKKQQNKPRNPVIRGMANNPKRHAGKHGQKLSKFKGTAMSTNPNTQTQAEMDSVELTDEETERWQEMEEAVIEVFQSRDADPNESMNVITHILARMAVLIGCPKEDLLAGVSQTYDHTEETFSVDFNHLQ